MPLYRWLMKLATNRQFRRWLIALGPVAAKSFQSFVSQMRHRESAIRQAEEIKGEFSVATIDGERHVIVWRDGRPLSSFPPLEGDLEEKLQFFDRSRLQRPEDLARRKAERRIQDLKNKRQRNKSEASQNTDLSL